MIWIYQTPDWPTFSWDAAVLSQKLSDIRHRQGRLLGRMETLGFDLRAEANIKTLTADVVKSSAIEGETLSASEVRSSRDIRSLLARSLLVQNASGGRSTSYRLPTAEELNF